MRLRAPLLALALYSVAAAPTDDLYKLGPDSLSQEGVPKGELLGPFTLESTKAFPGTSRQYSIYVPVQYKKEFPASLMVFQDGHTYMSANGSWRIPVVFDNLIYRREMPVTIAVFINPGRRPDQQEATSREWGDRTNNRGLEYNALDDKYATLICDELLPKIKADYAISDSPEDGAICGTSSGAIAAFTVAWHRPDQFRKVASSIGSFTNIRGGHQYPDMIRAAEKKPIRIHLHDGLNDNRGVRGRGDDAKYDEKWDWHVQNRRMLAALTDKGYDVNFTWTLGTHSGKSAGAQMPEILRWLWRDHPRPDDPFNDWNRTPLTPDSPRIKPPTTNPLATRPAPP